MNEKNIKNIIADVQSENLPYPFSILIEIVGLELLYKIIDELGGSTIYIPKLRTVFKETMNKQIIKEFNGYNYYMLALKYGVSERTIRNIVSNKKKDTI